MSRLVELSSSDAVLRVSWTLIHSMWQFALIAALLWIVLAMLRGKSTSVRYAIACCGLMLMLCTSLATYCVLVADQSFTVSVRAHATITNTAHHESEPSLNEAGFSSSLPSPGAEPSEAHGEPPIAPPREVASVVDERPQQDTANASTNSSLGLTARMRPWLSWIAVAWVAGVLVVSIRQAGGWVGVQRLRRRGVIPVTPDLNEQARQLMVRMRITRAVEMLRSTLAEGPITLGWLRPVILLPPSLLTGLPPQQLEAILAHELAHVRRCDYLVNLLQTAVETLLFYHPAVWWLSRRIRLEREHCCDDAAVAVCGSHVDYAEALAAVEQHREAPRFALAAKGGRGVNTLSRVRRILGVANTDVGAPRSGVGAVLVTLGLVAGWTGYLAFAGKTEANEQRPPADFESTFKKEYAVDGLAIEAGFVPDEIEPMLGQPCFVTFTVTNRANKPYRFSTGGDIRGSVRHNNFRITAVDAQGKAVRDPHSYNHFGGPAPIVTLKPGETHTERLFLGHWLAFERPGTYKLTFRRTLKDYGEEPRFAELAIESQFELHVKPLDREKMGQVIAQLAKQVRGDAEQRLREATLALGAIEDELVIPHLVASLRHGDYQSKIPAIEGLAKFPNADAAIGLRIALKDPDHAVRNAAVRALRKIGQIEVATTALLEDLNDESPVTREQAAKALAATGSGTALLPLIDALDDEESSVRCAAAVALGTIGDDDAREILRTLLASEDRHLRVAAADGLRRLSAIGEVDPEWLTPTIRETTNINDQSFHNAISLTRIHGGKAAAPALIGCLQFDDPSPRNTYNFFLILAIHHAAEGPDCYYRWKHDPNRDGTPAEVANNRKILTELREWAGNAGGAKDDVSKWGPTVDGVRMRATIDHMTVKSGREIEIRVDIHNAGDVDRRIDLEQEAWALQVNGTWLRVQGGVSGERRYLSLAAGQTQRNVRASAWLWENMKQALADLPPGKHTLRIARLLNGDSRSSSLPPQIRIVSQPITVEVAPAESTDPGEDSAPAIDPAQPKLGRVPIIPDYAKKEYSLTWRGFDGHDIDNVIYVLDGFDIGRAGEGLSSLSAIVDKIPMGSAITVVLERFKTLETPSISNPLTASSEFKAISQRAKQRKIRFVFPEDN